MGEAGGAVERDTGQSAKGSPAAVAPPRRRTGDWQHEGSSVLDLRKGRQMMFP
jgi:hypothetical protein